MSILESSHQQLRIVDGLTLPTLSLSGWEAFTMPRALTHTIITWALSPTVAQVMGVTPRSPCAHGVSGTPRAEVRGSWTMSMNYVGLKIRLWGTSTLMVNLTIFPWCNPKWSGDELNNQSTMLHGPRKSSWSIV